MEERGDKKGGREREVGSNGVNKGFGAKIMGRRKEYAVVCCRVEFDIEKGCVNGVSCSTSRRVTG